MTSYSIRRGTYVDEANVARGSEPRNGRPLGPIIARGTQESGPAFTSPPFDVSAEQFRNNHITLTPPHLAPPVPKARPANTQSVNKYQYRRMSCRWQILPNCTVVPAGIHMPPLSPAHFPCNGGKITSTNTHCANHPVVMTCGCTLRMLPPIHRSSPQSPPLCI